jgi:hypothetical protein
LKSRLNKNSLPEAHQHHLDYSLLRLYTSYYLVAKDKKLGYQSELCQLGGIEESKYRTQDITWQGIQGAISHAPMCRSQEGEGLLNPTLPEDNKLNQTCTFFFFWKQAYALARTIRDAEETRG